MNKYIVTAIALLSLTTPAYAAGEGFAETRIGYAWVGDLADTETLGIAVGYDTDVSGNAFVGIEANAYTDFNIIEPTIGTNVRLGFRTDEASKLFGTVGYAYDTFSDLDDVVLGAGFENKFGKLKLGIQYQRSLDLEINHLFVSLGTEF